MKAFPYRALISVQIGDVIVARYTRSYRGARYVAFGRMTQAALRKYPGAVRVTVAAIA